MVGAMTHEPWYERDRIENHTHSLGLVHHGSRDTGGHTVWRGEECAGVIHGVISNLGRLGMDVGTAFERVLEDPSVLATLDGPFVIACLDARDGGRAVVATDKLGTRPCYYSADDRVLFGSDLRALVTQIDDPTLDTQTVSDMLFMGNAWGERTLLEEVSTLPPATVLEHTDDGVHTERYWKPDFESAPREGYISELRDRYQQTIGDAATTVDGSLGVWLSGGLDSRTLAAEFARNADSLAAYTYDANPRGGGNPEIAGQVASRLGIPLTEVELTPMDFLDVIERCVDLTDGMLRWSSLLNLSAVFDVPAHGADVLVEASGQGELFGQHPRRYHLTHTDSVLEGLIRSETIVGADTPQALLNVDVDPYGSFKESIERSDEPTDEGTLLDISYTNYYPRMTFASNQVTRNRVGTRVPFASGVLLEHTARLPLVYRMGTFPCSDGTIPYGITRPKHELARSLGSGLHRIPYERTGLKPVRPFGAQLAGFVAKTGYSRLRSRIAYGGEKMPDAWYRRHPRFRSYVDGLLDDACERSVFCADAIRQLQDEHRRREAHHVTTSIAAVTTLELWLQRTLD
jgi:asparagine synthase (glutamine-hydrolysing)